MTLVLSPRWSWCAETGLREHTHVVVRDGRIAAILDTAPSLDAERIALPHGPLTPGPINLHNHAFSAPPFRGLADDIQPVWHPLRGDADAVIRRGAAAIENIRAEAARRGAIPGALASPRGLA